MITVRIESRWTDADGRTSIDDEWSIESDVAYSPDIADDLVRRVVALRAADRADAQHTLGGDR